MALHRDTKGVPFIDPTRTPREQRPSPQRSSERRPTPFSTRLLRTHGAAERLSPSTKKDAIIRFEWPFRIAPLEICPGRAAAMAVQSGTHAIGGSDDRSKGVQRGAVHTEQYLSEVLYQKSVCTGGMCAPMCGAIRACSRSR
jgi:hypothetical protein